MRASRTPHPSLALVAGLAALSLAGCISPSDPLSHREALEEAQKRYTEAIRWGDLQRASRYVDPELRDDFLALSEAFEDVHITDYEIGHVEVEDAELRHAEVWVTYRGYVLPYYVEQETRDHQVWTRTENLGDRWRVRPALEPMLAGLRGAR